MCVCERARAHLSLICRPIFFNIYYLYTRAHTMINCTRFDVLRFPRTISCVIFIITTVGRRLLNETHSRQPLCRHAVSFLFVKKKIVKNFNAVLVRVLTRPRCVYQSVIFRAGPLVFGCYSRPIRKIPNVFTI